MNKNIRFLSSVLVFCAFGVVDAYAVPTVRLLGTNTAQMAGKTVTQVTSAPTISTTSSPSRAGTMRARNVTASTPVTIKKTVKPSSVAEDSRLSIGKYIHATGVSTGAIAPVASASDMAAASNDILSLSDRISVLESDMETKQDILSVGDGLIFENNNIDLEPDYLALPDQVSDLQDELTLKTSDESLLEQLTQYFYTKDQMSDVFDEQIGSDINTIYDKATGQRTYVSIIDVFDKSILTRQDVPNPEIVEPEQPEGIEILN